MKQAHSLIIGVSIILGCLILSLQHSTPVAGQQPQLARGRYQMMATTGPGHGEVYVVDSETGQTWVRFNISSDKGEWVSLGRPVK